MAVLGNVGVSTEKDNFLQALFDKNKLQVFKPTTETVTEIRIIPEIASDSSILPMVKGSSPAGPDFSNIMIEEIVNGLGTNTKYSGFCRASDSDETNPIHMILSGLYIKAKNREKKNEIPAELRPKVAELLAAKPNPKRPEIKNSDLCRPNTTGFVQCVALQVKDKKLEKPKPKQVMVCSSSLCTQFAHFFAKCDKEGIDLFSPKDGMTVLIKGLPKDPLQGRNMPIFQCEIGRKLPLSEETCRKLWVPWLSAMQLKTRAEHTRLACKLVGPEVVKWLFPDEFEEFVGTTPTVAPPAPAPQPPKAVKVAPPAPPKTPEPPPLEVDADSPPEAIDGGVAEDDIPVHEEAPVPTTGKPSLNPAPAQVKPIAAPNEERLASEFERLLQNGL